MYKLSQPTIEVTGPPGPVRSPQPPLAPSWRSLGVSFCLFLFFVLFLDKKATSNLVPFSLHKLDVDSFTHTSLQCYLLVDIAPDIHPVLSIQFLCTATGPAEGVFRTQQALSGRVPGGARGQYKTETKESQPGCPKATCSATASMVHTKGWDEIWHQGNLVG